MKRALLATAAIIAATLGVGSTMPAQASTRSVTQVMRISQHDCALLRSAALATSDAGHSADRVRIAASAPDTPCTLVSTLTRTRVAAPAATSGYTPWCYNYYHTENINIVGAVNAGSIQTFVGLCGAGQYRPTTQWKNCYFNAWAIHADVTWCGVYTQSNDLYCVQPGMNGKFGPWSIPMWQPTNVWMRFYVCNSGWSSTDFGYW